MATIIVRRDSNFSGYSVVCDVYLDASSKSVGRIENGGVLEIPVEIGTHTLSIRPSVIEWNCIDYDVVVNQSHEVVELSLMIDPKKGFGFKIEKDSAFNQTARGSQQVNQKGSTGKKTELKHKNLLVDLNERVLATLDTKYIQNVVVDGKMANNSAVLTEKRLYYKGALFTGATETIGEYIVPISDISMTGFVLSENILFKLLGFFLAAIGVILFATGLFGDFDGILKFGIFFVLAGIVCLITSFLKKCSVFEVSFPGGRFRFDAKWYSVADLQNFQRLIHLQKDRCYEAEEQK